MGDLTKNLSRHEFACDCGCGNDAADFELVNLIQGAADHFVLKYNARRAIVTITGGNRCFTRNLDEGGVDGSKHLFNMAADVVIEVELQNRERVLISTDEQADYYESELTGRGGVGRYPDGRVHVDPCDGVSRPARWDKR